MKSLFSLVFVLFSFIALPSIETVYNDSLATEIVVEMYGGKEFADGFDDGYCEGWKDVRGRYAICPITPIPPLPQIGQDTYRGGYNLGFKMGTRAAYRN